MNNEATRFINKHRKKVVKTQVVWIFLKKIFWKFIGCTILALAYSEKEYRIWEETHKSDNSKARDKPKGISTIKNI